MRAALVLVLLFLLLPSLAGAFKYEEKLQDPLKEQQAQELFDEIRCLVCDGESLADSRAEFSLDMRALIREQLAEGKSGQKVIDFLVERYGEGVLMRPPLAPHTYLLWFFPLLLIVGGYFVLRGATKDES